MYRCGKTVNAMRVLNVDVIIAYKMSKKLSELELYKIVFKWP